MKAIGAAVIALFTLLSRAAFAEGGVDPGSIRIAAPGESSTNGGWYGWQTIIVLSASDALLLGSIAAKGDARYGLLAAGIGGHVLANPIVHLAHGHPARFGASFLLLLAGIAGGASGAAKGCSSDCGDAAIAGVIGGVLIANVVELSLLSSDKPGSNGVAKTFRVMPMAGPNRAGLTVGFAF